MTEKKAALKMNRAEKAEVLLEKNRDCMERIIFNVFKESDYEIYKSILE